MISIYTYIHTLDVHVTSTYNVYMLSISVCGYVCDIKMLNRAWYDQCIHFTL